MELPETRLAWWKKIVPRCYITTVFFEEFSSLLATLSNYTCQLLILGDTNVKFDLPQDLHTKHMLRLLTSHSLTQLITEPTHNLGHTLDVIIYHVHPLLLTISTYFLQFTLITVLSTLQ